jgi:SagB-type dehydrogenase family enzyme
MMEEVGKAFQNRTKYQREAYSQGYLEWQQKIEKLKAQMVDKSVSLPEPDLTDGKPVFQVISRRRSRREFARKPVPLPFVSQVLWAASGLSFRKGDFYLKTAPSAGALYPVETYLSAHLVDGLEAGLYHYQAENHSLRMKYAGNFGPVLASSALNQDFLSEAGFILLFTAVFSKGSWKYGDRAFRYIYLDAGHAAQNAALAAVSCGLVSCPVAAFFDDEINSILDLNPERQDILYLMAFGFPA